MFELPAYPGRGIAIHRHHDGRLEWIYFLTGRSDDSRHRVLHAEADRVLVEPTAETGAPDPLRHYACVRLVGAHLVIGNGDHVDLIADAIVAGQPLREVLGDIDPEPDAPIHTPRIAVVAPSLQAPDLRRPGSLAPGVDVVTAVRDETGTKRQIEVVPLPAGAGVLIHTYGGDTTDVTSDARPRRFDAGPPGTDVAGRLWHSLDQELRVALAVGLVPSPIPERVLNERRP